MNSSNKMSLSVDFVEFVTDDIHFLSSLFNNMGFKYRGKIESQSVFVFTQGDIVFLLHEAKSGGAFNFFKKHGTSIASIGLQTVSSEAFIERAKEYGYAIITPEVATLKNFSGIMGIGQSLIYLINPSDSVKNLLGDSLTELESNADKYNSDNLLEQIDHIAMNVYPGETKQWKEFFNKIFGFIEIEDFEINGHHTRFTTHALGLPSGGLKIVISESDDEKSQISEYLRIYNGAGIQHLAFTSSDIYKSVENLKSNQIDFMPIPQTYYQNINNRLPSHHENGDQLSRLGILIDGKSENEILLQIFTQCLVGPIFFEIITRKGNEGFGAGNITALFESVEQDQIKRKVLHGELS